MQRFYNLKLDEVTVRVEADVFGTVIGVAFPQGFVWASSFSKETIAYWERCIHKINEDHQFLIERVKNI